MLIQTTQEILDYKNEPIPNGTDGTLTVRDAVFLALNNFVEGETPTGQQKLDAFAICSKMFAGPTAELTIDEAKLIKDRSGAIAGTLIHGRLCEILESAMQIPAASTTNGQADHPVELSSTVD